MKFSEHYEVGRSEVDDWVDPYLPSDTKLFIDPFLIYEDPAPIWSTAHAHLLDFFEMVFGLVAEAKGDEKSPAWGKAKALLLFPEPSEFCLGLAEASTDGSGSGNGLQIAMLDSVRVAAGHGMGNVSHMETLVLFQGGMGLDRISDAVCNILKSYFIEYTQKVCESHGIPMEKFRVRNASWSKKHLRWNEGDVRLPVNPYYPKRPVLLTPERFVRDIPVVDPDKFWEYAWTNHAEDLRHDFNYDLARNVDRWKKAMLARQNPAIVVEYLAVLEEQPHQPYSIQDDPKLKVRWYEVGAEVARRSPLSFTPGSKGEFSRFVETVLTAFKYSIERQGIWESLWPHKKSLGERGVQNIFRGSAIHYCRANNIVLSGESNAGRGPVDFKFSRGWSSQALVELKLMRNSSFWDGLLEQTPTYLLAEEVDVAYFVAVAYTDDEVKAERIEKVHKAAELVAENYPGKVVLPLVIDARQQVSASKLKADPETRAKLHGEDGSA